MLPRKSWEWPPSKIDHRGTAALELDDLEVDAGHRLEELGGQVDEAAAARGRRHELARLFLGQRDQLLNRIGRNARMNDQGGRRIADLGDRDKGLEGVVGLRRVKQGVENDGRGVE